MQVEIVINRYAGTYSTEKKEFEIDLDKFNVVNFYSSVLESNSFQKIQNFPNLICTGIAVAGKKITIYCEEKNEQ